MSVKRRVEEDDYLNDTNHLRICPICGERWSTLPYDMSRYVYKHNNVIVCRYNCYIKLLDKRKKRKE